jgi:hypothetical protein
VHSAASDPPEPKDPFAEALANVHDDVLEDGDVHGDAVRIRSTSNGCGEVFSVARDG